MNAFSAFSLAIALLALITWRRGGGPLFALALGWTICLAPTALGIVQYSFVSDSNTRYIWLLVTATASFAGGTMIVDLLFPRPKTANTSVSIKGDFANWRPFEGPCLFIAAIGILSALANVVLMGGNIFDLSVVRALATNGDSANVFGRTSAVTLWACFFCFGYAVYFRTLLDRRKLVLLLLASTGIFISALGQAGRQAPIQLVLLAFLIEMVRVQRVGAKSTGKVGVVGLSILLSIGFVLFVTINRTSGTFYEDKGTILLRLFGASLSNPIASILYQGPQLFRDVFIEFTVYITQSVPLFSVTSSIDFGQHYWGTFEFPFVARQLSPLLGNDVLAALDHKRQYIGTEGVIGAGWDTAISNLLIDFGPIGMTIFMFVQGAVSQIYWNSMRAGAGFGTVFVTVLLLITATCTPYFWALSDTNLFFLIIFFCFVVPLLRSTMRRAVASRAAPRQRGPGQ